MSVRQRVAAALRALARRIESTPQTATPATPDTLGPQMRRARAAIAEREQATRLLETAVQFDPQARRFTLREEMFSSRDEQKA